jgi:hypothetical protein
LVPNGGTGLANIPAGNIIIGNGTSALYGVAPGTAGNVLTSIGGVWTSNAAVGGGNAGVSSISFGSTGLTPSTDTTGNVTVSGTLAVGSGGTGSSSLTANNVILGNGTSNLQVVAPGTSGNVLTSNGTIWSSSAPSVPSSGGVGTYIFAYYNSGAILGFGATTTGSNLLYCSASGNSPGGYSGSPGTGTWKCMGYADGVTGGSFGATLFIRTI